MSCGLGRPMELLRRKDGRMERFSVDDGLASDSIVSLDTDASQEVLVETTAGWSRWNGKRFDALQSGGPHNARWSVSGLALTVIARGVTHTWRIGGELPAGRIATLLVDREGFAWIGMNRGLFVADPATAVVTKVDALNGNSVLSIAEDAEGNHWIGTETSGLHVLRLMKFRSEVGLAGTPVTSVAQTTDGTMWAGLVMMGLRRLRGGTWEQPLVARDLTSLVVLCEAPGLRGGLWVGTPDGLNFIAADGKVLRITSAEGLPDDYVRSLAGEADGSVVGGDAARAWCICAWTLARSR